MNRRDVLLSSLGLTALPTDPAGLSFAKMPDQGIIFIELEMRLTDEQRKKAISGLREQFSRCSASGLKPVLLDGGMKVALGHRHVSTERIGWHEVSFATDSEELMLEYLKGNRKQADE